MLTSWPAPQHPAGPPNHGRQVYEPNQPPSRVNRTLAHNNCGMLIFPFTGFMFRTWIATELPTKSTRGDELFYASPMTKSRVVIATNRRSDESRTTASALRLSCYIIDDVTRPNTAYTEYRLSRHSLPHCSGHIFNNFERNILIGYIYIYMFISYSFAVHNEVYKYRSA
jgi:hypothetical protein